MQKDPVSKGIEILRRLTLRSIKTKESNWHNGRKSNLMTIVVDVTYVLAEWVPTNVTDVEKWSIGLPVAKIKKEPSGEQRKA